MDLRNVVEGDASPDGKGTLKLQRGIEVGHVFFLGTRYSEPMQATFLDENGKPQPIQMGCYGIGVTRVAGAAIEQCHDEKGIIWPESIAPFEVVICPMNYSKSEAVRNAADALYESLKAEGVDVILDDRDLRRRDVRRLGADRRAAPHRDRRPRPQERRGRIRRPPQSR